MALVGSLVVSLSARTTDLERGLNRGAKSVQDFSKQVQGALTAIPKSLSSIAGMATALPAALGGFAAVTWLSRAVQTIADFEQKMSDVRAVTQATQKQMQALQAEARRLGAATAFSASQAAEGMAILGQAGFKTEQILAAMGDTLNLAAAGGLELADAAGIVSNILSTFNLQATETKRVADVLAAAASNSNTNVQQLGEAFSFAGPIAAGFGHNIEATAAALAVLSNRGIQGSRAGEGLRRVLGTLADPTKEVRDALDGLQKIFPELELSAAKLNPQTNSTADIFQRLAPILTDTRVAFKLFGIEGAGIAQILSQNIPQLRQLEALVQSSGQAAAQASIRMDNLKGDFEELKGAIEELSLGLGDQGLVGGLRSAIQVMTRVIRESYALRQAIILIGGAFDLVVRSITIVVTTFDYSFSQMYRQAVYWGTRIRAAVATIVPGNLLGNADELNARIKQLGEESSKAWEGYKRDIATATGMNDKFTSAVRDAHDAMTEDPFVAQFNLPAPLPQSPFGIPQDRKLALDKFLEDGGATGKKAVVTVEDITKSVKELQSNLAALDRQAAMGIPGFDLAAERARLLEGVLRDVTTTLSRHPELAAQLPPEIRASVQAMGPQLRSFQQIADAQEKAREAARQAAQEEERKAQQAAEMVRSLALEAETLQQQLAIQRQGKGQQEERNRLLEFEMQLKERDLQLSEAQRQEAERHLQVINETQAAIKAARKAQEDAEWREESVRKLEEEVELARQLVSIERMGTEQREMASRILTMEAEAIANKVQLTDAYRQRIRELAAEEARINTATAKATLFRDLGEETADLQAVLAAQNLSRREREIEIALIQEKRRLNRLMLPEEEQALRQQIAMQRDLNEEINRPRPLRDFLESGTDLLTRLEEGAVELLQGFEDAFVRFASTGTFQSPEQLQAQQDLNMLVRDRKAMVQEIRHLESLPIQYGPEQLRHQERVDALDREVDLLDERKKALEENIRSQNALNKLVKSFFDEMLQASIRNLFTMPFAQHGDQVSQNLRSMQGQGGGMNWGQIAQWGMNLLSGIFGGGTATAGQAANAIQGFRAAGYTQGIVSHAGGTVGRDTFPRVLVHASAFARAPRFATGGLVAGSGDNVPALLQTGERVLSRRETERLARLETMANYMSASGQAPQNMTTVTINFPGVTNRQEAEGIRRSMSQIQNNITMAIERSRARTNVPSTAR